MWLPRLESIFITTEEAADSLVYTRLYPVHDLVRSDNPKNRQADFRTLVEKTTSVVAPKTWDDGVAGYGSIETLAVGHAKILVVSQTLKVHSEIAELLEELRTKWRNNPKLD